MLKDKTLTYISLFSSAGVGCYGFKMAGYHCVATNEYIERRLDIQRYNNKCEYDTGYILGDIKHRETKDAIYKEIERYKRLGNDGIDVLIATPPCQGMSVANHKKSDKEIDRNSLVVESISLTKSIKPRFFLFENVATFLTTGCTAPDGTIKTIKAVINDELATEYVISAEVINFKNYGSNSSRTRTLVVGVRRDYEEYISPIDLFPRYSKEKTLKEVIGRFRSLSWGEIDQNDILHAFRTYPKEMREWISCLDEGESAFNNADPFKRPHRIVNGEIVFNVNKNGDKYTRQPWNKVGPCIHTRNDQLASQNTIHPSDDRVFSIRELMQLMTIPDSFKWTSIEYTALNQMTDIDKKRFYKNNEINIRQSIGEAVPTNIFYQIANNIKHEIATNSNRINIQEVIIDNKLDNHDQLIQFIKSNKQKYSFSQLCKIAEMANVKRTSTAAYYTNKSLLNSIYEQMPKTEKEEINILEPSVGVGNFLPYIFKKYESVHKVNIDVIDIDNDSLELLKELLSLISVPSNIKLSFINCDYLKYKTNKKYYLIIGNPPFTKVKRSAEPDYFKNVYNTDTTNLSALFLEKAIAESVYVCLIEPKTIINTVEFAKTRELISKYRINSIIDFGEKGFKGVLIETVCLNIQTNAYAGKTIIKHITYGINNTIKQKILTSNKYPYWILYRNDFFDAIAAKLRFNVFYVFRDRQISNKDLVKEPGFNTVRVLKSRNIGDDGSIINIEGYDRYINLDVLKKKNVYKYYNDNSVYLAPNMTYNPRVIRNQSNSTVNGSVAILIPKEIGITNTQLNYYSSEEFRCFYRIARNYQTRSLNIDESSVFFFGLLEEE